jgi:hypothetical protein
MQFMICTARRHISFGWINQTGWGITARLGKKCVQNFDGELEGRRPLGRTSCRLEHNTVIDVKERGLGLVTSVHPFVCSRGTTRLPLHGLSCDFILEISNKYFETFQFRLMSDEITTRHKYIRRLRQKCKKYNSNKSPTRCNNFPVYYPDVYLQLNMFRAFFHPSSGAQWLQWQPLVLPSYRGDSCAVFVVGPGRPDHEHSATITTIRRHNQRLPLQSLSSWRWAGKRPKHVEL